MAAEMTPSVTARPTAYAGFWRRVGGLLIDSILLSVVLTPLYLALRDQLATWSALQTGVTWLYFALMESSTRQATLGKMAMGIVVTDMDGNRIGFGRATGRYFAKIISGLILGIGYLMAAFTRRKQGLHDLIVGTLVLKKAA
jgi:uncharacterized RDD family membrane protein YckC